MNTQETENSKLSAVTPDKLSFSLPLGDERHPDRVEFNIHDRKHLFFLILVLSALLIIWSWFTELSEIAEAPGRMLPAENVQPIRAAFDSKIVALLVKPGDAVKRGDLLLKLDAKTFRADLVKYEHELEIAQRELERHEHAYGVLHGYLKTPSELPSDLSSVTAVAKAIGDLYEAEQRLQRAELDMKLSPVIGKGKHTELGSLKSQQKSLMEQQELKAMALAERRKHFALEEEKQASKVASIQEQLEIQKIAVEQRKYSLECAEKQLKAYEMVFARGASSKTECLDAKIRVEDRQRDLTIAESRERELEGQLETARHELAQLRSRNAMQVSQMKAGVGDVAASETQLTIRMRNAERNLIDAQTSLHVATRAGRSTHANEQSLINNLKKQVAELKASIASEAHAYEKGELRSPVDGTVALVHCTGVGEVLQRGQDLLTIVPEREKLVACIYVPNEQISYIHKGESVKLQFPAYPYQQYGTVSGVIRIIDEFPSQEKEHEKSYKVILEPKQDWILCRGKKIPLRKGLEVQAQLVLRKRRLLMTVIAPLLKLQYVHFKA